MKGDHANNFLVNCELFQFAAGKAGLVLVNINPAYQASELKYCLNKVLYRCHQRILSCCDLPVYKYFIGKFVGNKFYVYYCVPGTVTVRFMLQQ
jgi:hypothetical protein